MVSFLWDDAYIKKTLAANRKEYHMYVCVHVYIIGV